ncbi:MAG: ABC transporter ATP-binding protein/permease [Alphaproteobacteria bacterium]|nr:MAG: ABC transporter ATP-binding protein/permease [Alphaproteobacteria bacterium]
MYGVGRAQADELSRRRYLLRRFWAAGLGYWRLSSGDHSAWVLTSALLLLVLLNLGISYQMNLWNRAIFDALEQRSSAAVLLQAISYLPLIAISVAVGTLTVYARMTIQRLWRAWLNRDVLDRWLVNSRYYQLNLVQGDHGNPEYRLADDLRVATEAVIDFGVGLTWALLSAVTFIFILWTIGGSLSLTLGDTVITIPCFLVLAAALYALLASGLMVFVGRRFVTVAESKNQAEAEYRYTLTRVRENADSIALIGGQDEERRTVEQSFGTVLGRWRDISIQAVRATLVSQTSGYLAAVLPILLCAPKFLDGSMTLGQVMQAASAFTVVQTALSWLVDNYPRFAEWSASARRVASLMISIDMLEAGENGNGASRIRHSETKDAALRLCNLSVTLENATAVVKHAELTIARGERILVVGQSGAGKSSLVRAICGQWPWGKGEVQCASKIFVVPQRPYIPLGTLLRAVAYPASADKVAREDIAKALNAVGLEHLVDRLDEDGVPWEQTLSGGEKQRLAFARLLITRPNIIVMDEATSALDLVSQKQLIELIHDRLHTATIIGIGHRPELQAFYDRKLELQSGHDGARLTREVDLSRVAPFSRDFRPDRAGVLHHAAGAARMKQSGNPGHRDDSARLVAQAR